MHSLAVDRVMDPASGVTKSQLLRYYESVLDSLAVHLRERPVAFLRAPEGIGSAMFLQKHPSVYVMPGVAQLHSTLYASLGPMMEVREPQGVRSAVKGNVIEFHTFNTTAHGNENPDRACFDLDPGAGVPWSAVAAGARHLRDLLAALGLQCWLKTTGGTGLHVLVPLAPALHHCDVVKAFCKSVVTRLVQEEPQRFSAKSGAANRIGRIFIDSLRNSTGATMVAAWSARARVGVPLSVPLDWSELDSLPSPAPWTVSNASERVGQGNRPWEGYWSCKQTLREALAQLQQR